MWNLIPDISDKWVPAVSGAIGGLGAISAQVIAACFTARRDKRSQKIARLAAYDTRFIDQRRELFIKVLGFVDQQVSEYAKAFDAAVTSEEWPMPSAAFLSDVWKQESGLELDLLAADVLPPFNQMIKTFQFAEECMRDGDRENMLLMLRESFPTFRYELMKEMRKSLGARDIEPKEEGFFRKSEGKRGR